MSATPDFSELDSETAHRTGDFSELDSGAAHRTGDFSELDLETAHRTSDFSELDSETARRTADYIRRAPVPAVPAKARAAACRLAARCIQPKALARRDFRRALCACLSLNAAPFSVLCAFVLAGMVVLSRLTATQSGIALACVTALAPVPILSFAIRERHCRDSALAQIEKTCRFAPEKLWFARLWASTLASACCVGAAGAVISPRGVRLVRLYLCAFTALFLVGAAAVFLLSVLESALPLSLLLAAWAGGAACLLAQPEILEYLWTASLALLTGALAVSLGLFLFAAAHAAVRQYGKG